MRPKLTASHRRIQRAFHGSGGWFSGEARLLYSILELARHVD
jgi:hypothetical protein